MTIKSPEKVKPLTIETIETLSAKTLKTEKIHIKLPAKIKQKHTNITHKYAWNEYMYAVHTDQNWWRLQRRSSLFVDFNKFVLYLPD